MDSNALKFQNRYLTNSETFHILRGLLSLYTVKRIIRNLRSYILLKQGSHSYQHNDSPHTQHQHTCCHFRTTKDKRRHFQSYSQNSATKSNLLSCIVSPNFFQLLSIVSWLCKDFLSAETWYFIIKVRTLFLQGSKQASVTICV